MKVKVKFFNLIARTPEKEILEKRVFLTERPTKKEAKEFFEEGSIVAVISIETEVEEIEVPFEVIKQLVEAN